MFKRKQDKIPSFEALSFEPALSKIPVVLRHLNGGYLSQDPNPTKLDRAAVANDENIVPFKPFYMIPMKSNPPSGHGTSELIISDSSQIIFKSDFSKELQKLITDPEKGMTFTVALQDADTGRYLTSRGQRKASLNNYIRTSEFQTKPEYFCLHRTDTGSFSFKTISDKRGLYMYKAHKTENQDMQGSNGEKASIRKSLVQFSDKLNNIDNCNKWAIEPVFLPDSSPEEHQPIQHDNILPTRSTFHTNNETDELHLEVQKLTEQMRENFVSLENNKEKAGALLLLADDLHKSAKLFKKRARKIPNGNHSIILKTVAVGIGGIAVASIACYLFGGSKAKSVSRQPT